MCGDLRAPCCWQEATWLSGDSSLTSLRSAAAEAATKEQAAQERLEAKRADYAQMLRLTNLREEQLEQMERASPRDRKRAVHKARKPFVEATVRSQQQQR